MNNLHQENKLRADIMSRVWMIYFSRRLFYGPVGKAAILGLALVIMFFSISLKNVFINMPSPIEPYFFLSFLTSAFINTEFLIKALVIVISAAGLFLIKDIFVSLAASGEAVISGRRLKV